MADTVLTATRRRPGSTPTSSAKGRSLPGGLHHASRSGRLRTSRTAAASATVRATTPSVDMPAQWGYEIGHPAAAGLVAHQAAA